MATDKHARPADKLAGAGSFSDALKKARQAREQGNLREARQIMRDFEKKRKARKTLLSE